MGSLLFFVAKFLESSIGAQRIPDQSELKKGRPSDEHACKSDGRKTGSPRRPENYPRDSAALRFWHLSKDQAQGLIHIVAELGAPTAYPKPSFSVTTTLYDRRLDDPLGSGNVWTRSFRSRIVRCTPERQAQRNQLLRSRCRLL